MTEPNTPQQTTGQPNPQPPHAATQPDNAAPAQQQRQPVVVNAPDQSGLAQQLTDMGRTLAGLPEQIVNGFREATQPAQQPAQQTPVQQAQQGGQQQQAPGTNQNPAPETGAAPKSGPKVSRFASWWYKQGGGNS